MALLAAEVADENGVARFGPGELKGLLEENASGFPMTQAGCQRGVKTARWLGLIEANVGISELLLAGPAQELQHDGRGLT